jgi:hypothetical protein
LRNLKPPRLDRSAHLAADHSLKMASGGALIETA